MQEEVADMINETLGTQFKKIARVKGNFVETNICNLYNVLDTLSIFFYRKKHEWIAICFLDNEFICKLIWFNKGASHKSANIELSIEKAIEVAIEKNIKYIVLSHNHPISYQDLPDYGSRRLNIQASYDLKSGLLGFSDQDMISGSIWQSAFNDVGIGYADAVFVAGNYKISGDSQLIDNYNQHKPSISYGGGGCFISSAVFGHHSFETHFLKNLRDKILMENISGRAFCRTYYLISPWLSKYARNHILLYTSLKFIILILIRLLKKYSTTFINNGRRKP